MKSTRIPGTDLEPSCICLGTATFGSLLSEADSFELLDTYCEMGGTFLDTAHNYGASETTVGKWLQKRGNRPGLIIATKGGSCDPRTFEAHSSYSEVIGQLDQSLEKLRVDCIDLYWFHRDDPNRPVAHFVDMMNEQIAKGKIKNFGCSNWTVARIEAAMEYAKKNRLRGFAASQMWWSLATPNLEKCSDKTAVWMDPPCREFHARTNLAAVPYSSQGRGFFFKLNNLSPAERPEFIRENLYGTGENIAKFERVKKLASDRSVSIPEIELGYLLSHPFPTIPIIGCRSPSQLRTSLKAASLALAPEMIRYLDGE